MPETLRQQLIEKGYVSEERASLLDKKTPRNYQPKNTKVKVAKDLTRFRSWAVLSWSGMANPPEDFSKVCAKCGKSAIGLSEAPQDLISEMRSRFPKRARTLVVCEVCNEV